MRFKQANISSNMIFSLVFLVFNHLAGARTFNATFDQGPSRGISLREINTEYNPITSPATGNTVKTGDQYPLKCTRNVNEFIEFKLFRVQSENYYVWADIEFNVPVNTPGSYAWSVAKTIPSGSNYVLTSNLLGMSQVFSITNPDIASPQSPAAGPQNSPTTLSTSTTTAGVVAGGGGAGGSGPSASVPSGSGSGSDTSSGSTRSASDSAGTGAAGSGVAGTGATTGAGSTAGNTSSNNGGSGSSTTGNSSSSPQTQTKSGLDNGAIIGLVFGLVALLASIITFIYMQKTKRACFG